MLGNDFRRNVSDQTLSLVFYPTPMQNVQFFFFFFFFFCVSLQLLCEMADKTYNGMFLLPFPLRSLVLRGHEQILWTKLVNGIVSFIQIVGNIK